MRQRVSYNSDPFPFICKQDDLMKTMEELEVIRNSGDGRSRRESSVALANLEDGAAAAAVIQPATIHQQVEEIGGSAAGLGLSPADKMDACHSIFHERAISEVSNILNNFGNVGKL